MFCLLFIDSKLSLSLIERERERERESESERPVCYCSLGGFVVCWVE